MLSRAASGQAVALNARHRAALAGASAALTGAGGLTECGETLDSAELLAGELREAIHQVGTITGAVMAEDLLERIFADFCIGK